MVGEGGRKQKMIRLVRVRRGDFRMDWGGPRMVDPGRGTFKTEVVGVGGIRGCDCGGRGKGESTVSPS